MFRKAKRPCGYVTDAWPSAAVGGRDGAVVSSTVVEAVAAPTSQDSTTIGGRLPNRPTLTRPAGEWQYKPASDLRVHAADGYLDGNADVSGQRRPKRTATDAALDKEKADLDEFLKLTGAHCQGVEAAAAAGASRTANQPDTTPCNAATLPPELREELCRQFVAALSLVALCAIHS